MTNTTPPRLRDWVRIPLGPEGELAAIGDPAETDRPYAIRYGDGAAYAEQVELIARWQPPAVRPGDRVTILRRLPLTHSAFDGWTGTLVAVRAPLTEERPYKVDLGDGTVVWAHHITDPPNPDTPF